VEAASKTTPKGSLPEQHEDRCSPGKNSYYQIIWINISLP
jgi:hypothetical protein